ncbi:MAG: SdpI family protein [Alkaliphilus sp.]
MLIYALCGLFIHKVKPNCIVGIKTRWTLESNEVWNYIHSSSRILFLMASGTSFLVLAIPIVTEATKVILICLLTLILSAYLIYASYRKYQTVVVRNKR